MNPNDAARLLETAFQLADLGRGSVEPNPRVGALALSRGRIVGRGHHAEYGGPHAEVAALEDANKAGQRPDGMLVTLEPCSTAGKTPPCVEAILRAGIRWVGFAAVDPNPQHLGRAVSRLREHGVETVHLGQDARFRAQNRPFLRAVERTRPWVIAKWAMTLDGRTALSNGDSRWVSGEESRARVHRLRGRCEAVAVGVSTVLSDDPLLTCRDAAPPPKPPVRVIFDSMLRTPLDARVVTDRSAPTWFVAATGAPSDRRKALERAGAQVVEAPAESQPSLPAPRVSLPAALELLHSLGIRRMLVESGSELVGALRSARLVDQMLVFVAPKLAGGPAMLPGPAVVSGPAAFPGPAGAPEAESMTSAPSLEEVYVERSGEDVVIGGFLGLGDAP